MHRVAFVLSLTGRTVWSSMCTTPWSQEDTSMTLRELAVDVVCREGPARVMELVAMGAEFTRNQDGSLHLTKEGGHSARRIVHAADLTGREIERALLAAARAHKNIRFFEHHLAVDLVVEDHQGMPHCFGIDPLLSMKGQAAFLCHMVLCHVCRYITPRFCAAAVCMFVALSTMLASGGAGQVYPSTTNPHVATGDGIAMAFRASATISNMEFVQFHPTALYEPANTGRTFLITEAVRGEGGMLFNKAGERFMQKYDSVRMELAPRDVVAQSIPGSTYKKSKGARKICSEWPAIQRATSPLKPHSTLRNSSATHCAVRSKVVLKLEALKIEMSSGSGNVEASASTRDHSF
ncbi:L-aspartate oxidase [Haematococcus lacustris]|uniref:L-aspartate oxidase n=1 Tax=Haematococcus lacustris TaxID=44745 RepID=A0A699Z6L8_HAELA|nr:L-aspartate oxidase [Haematococcus lacustris]